MAKTPPATAESQHGAAAAPAKPTSLRERKKIKTAAAIYDAAIELFAEHAYAEVSIEDICEKAEVGRATFFRIYGTKTGLLMEFNRRVAVAARGRIHLNGAESSIAQLRILAEEIGVAWSISGSGMVSLAGEMLRDGLVGEAMSAGVTDDAPNIHDPLLELVGQVLGAGIDRGEFDLARVPLPVMAYLMVTGLAACVADWLMRPGTRDVTEVVEHMLDVLLRGICTDPIR